MVTEEQEKRYIFIGKCFAEAAKAAHLTDKQYKVFANTFIRKLNEGGRDESKSPN